MNARIARENGRCLVVRANGTALPGSETKDPRSDAQTRIPPMPSLP